MEQPILKGLISHNMKSCYPWHMPGHKQRLNTLFPELVEDPFTIDLTEVGDLDEFHDPKGIILEAQERAASIYGSNKSYYLVNGSTCGILAAISAVCKTGDTLIVARNCHKSVYHAIRLLCLKPVYIMPEWNDALEMFGGIASGSVKKALQEYPEAKAVILVSPTYEGVVSDIEKIAKLVHKAEIPLIVDEAHGAHFEYMANVNETISAVNYKKVPDPAIRLGADLVVESLHKTLPAMTQCAILHEKSRYVDGRRLEEFLSIYQSTSPSYVFMASAEACIEKMEHERDGLFILYKQLLSEYRKVFGQLKHIHLVSKEDFDKKSTFGYDDGKLVFSIKNCGIQHGDKVIPFSGVLLGHMLEMEYGQMMEMTGGSYVIAMTSVADGREAFDSLYHAMEAIDNQLIYCEDTADITLYKTLPEYHMDIHDAIDSNKTELPLMETEGRISGSYIYVYPPGIPIVAPGEVLTGELLKEIRRAWEKGLNIKGIFQKEGKDISILVTS